MQTAGEASRHTTRRLLLLVGLTAVVAALTTVGAVAASSQFFDVNAGDTHEEGINFMADTGVTVGCAANAFCPDDPVTRAQMATFMHRLSGTDGETAPSVNAATVGGMSASSIKGIRNAIPEVLAARVSSNADLQSGTGVADVSILGNSFVIEFEREIDACTFSATASLDDGDLSFPVISRTFGDENTILIGFVTADGTYDVPAWELTGVCAD